MSFADCLIVIQEVDIKSISFFIFSFMIFAQTTSHVFGVKFATFTPEPHLD
jgi:hypothetical protein